MTTVTRIGPGQLKCQTRRVSHHKQGTHFLFTLSHCVAEQKCEFIVYLITLQTSSACGHQLQRTESCFQNNPVTDAISLQAVEMVKMNGVVGLFQSFVLSVCAVVQLSHTTEAHRIAAGWVPALTIAAAVITSQL